jgi:hypothetical protein
MSMIRKTNVIFLTIITIFFVINNTILCTEPIVLSISPKIQSYKNIIVRKIVSEKFQIQRIDKTSKFTFEIYPNPVSSGEARLILNNSDFKIEKIKLINLVTYESINNYSTKFDDGLLKFINIVKGNYLVFVILENGVCSSKIIMIE